MRVQEKGKTKESVVEEGLIVGSADGIEDGSVEGITVGAFEGIVVGENDGDVEGEVDGTTLLIYSVTAYCHRRRRRLWHRHRRLMSV